MKTLPRPVRVALMLLALVALPLVVGRGAPGALTEARALILGTAVCFAAAALALNLLTGYAGQISLGHFALLGVGAFASGLLTNPYRLGLPFVLAIPLAALAGAAVAFVVGLPALRLRGLYLAIATIGFSYAMEESVFRANFLTRGSAGLELPRPLFGDYALARNADYLAVLVLLLGLLWLLDRNVTVTRVGRAFQAIRADESVAAAYGIDVSRYKLLAFTISGAMAGVAGAMYGHLYQFVSATTFRYELSLMLVVIVVVGGLGSRVGVVISGIFFVVLPEVLTHFFGNDLLDVVPLVGSVLLMFAMARHPGGVAQALRESRERKEAKRRDPAAEPAALPSLPDMPRPTGLAPRPAEAAGHPLLAVRDIAVSFGGLKAVDGVSLEVHRNRIVGLIGPNGAGKTTLFNAVSGLVPLDGGTIELLGRDVTQSPPHARAAAGMGRTFQLIGLAKDLSVSENLLLAQHSVAGYSIAEALVHLGRAPKVERELRERAAAAVVALGFERYADTPVRLLSHGQQRIVELGCVLVTAPELVLLDEPSAGMSPGAAENLAVRLRDIRDQLGRTVLLIEHNIPLVLDVCDELYVLDAGRVLAHGPAAYVAQLPEVVGAYLGEAVPA